MKIIEGMKKTKDLTAKAEDLRKKVAAYCADMTFETPTYGSAEEQSTKIKEWLQAHSDIAKEILRLRVAIQRTNLQTPVTIEFNGKSATKNIAEWIHRRRDLAALEQEMWAGLGRKESQMREGTMQSSTGDKVEARIRRYYNPGQRDQMVDLYRSEPLKIDATLEVVNAVTDLIEE